MTTNVKFKGKRITVGKIVEAIGKFDRNIDNEKSHGGKTFAVWYQAKSYPPKKILSLATGLRVNSFSGGEETHRVFRHLGFRVCYKPDGPAENATINASHERKVKEKE